MSEKILVVYKEPHPKERPRGRIVTPKEGKPFIQWYTPKETTEHEEAIARAWKEKNGLTPYQGPVIVRIVFGLKIPKSTSKARIKQMLDRKIRPIVKPDVDNCAKSVLDALNGLAYEDDNQIVSLSVRKYYTDIPKILIKVAEWIPKEGEE